MIIMSNRPSRPSRPKPVLAKNVPSGTLMQGSTALPSLSVVSPGPAPANAIENPLQKFAQLILYGIAMVAIWGGIIAIAFAENSTNLNFLILGVGGLVSAAMALSLVEWQRNKGGDDLHSVHDYLIGIGFFFSAVGVLWGSRWLIGFAASNDITWLIADGVPYTESDWYPSVNAIYVQLVACVILILGQMWYLERLKGQTTFGWSVTTFTPLVLALIGFGPWMKWSNDIVSWELGISIISLTALSMWLALRSNSGMIFAVVAIFSGLIPIFYEMQNNPVDQSGAGGALSLMIFIIIIQGLLAADNRLRQDLMQWTSIFLVGEVVIAMLITRVAELNLILGPIRGDELGDLSSIITLQVVLWVTVLLAYFPATLKRRIPYMPIGLAASLFLITPQASIIPWIITIIMLPYLVIISKVTRPWVANSTMIAAGAAFFLQSHLNDSGFYYQYFDVLIIISLLAVGELGRLKGKLSDFAHFLTLALVVLSSSVLFGDDTLVPWTIVIYSLVSSYLMMDKAQKIGDENSAFGASTALFTTMLLSVVLSFSNRLEVPLPDSIMDALSGFNITLAIVGIAVYLSMLKFKDTELDLGVLVGIGNIGRKKLIPVFDIKSGTWVVPEQVEQEEPQSWGAISRMSLLGPLLLFSIAVSSISSENMALDIQWIVLMIIPIGIIVKEVIDDVNASSITRMVAIWVMIIIALPVSLKLNYSASVVDELIINGILFDLMLLSGPIIISTLLNKKGLNEEFLDETADRITLVGLLALGLIDSSGGILFLSMYLLVFSRAIKHRQNTILSLAPIALLIFQDRFAWDSSMIYSLLQLVDFTSYNPSDITVFGMTRLSCLIMAVTALIILGKGVVEGRTGLKENQFQTPMALPSVWLAIGLSGVLTEIGWLLLILTIILSLYSWLSGRIEFIPWSPVFLFISLIVGFASSDKLSYLSETDNVSYSFLFTGLYSLILNQMTINKSLFKWSDEIDENAAEVMQILDLSTISGRQQMVEASKYLTLICLTLSWTSLYGLGTLIGAIWITKESINSGQKNVMLGLPVLHAFAIGNSMIQSPFFSEFQIDLIIGLVLMSNGLLMTAMATKTELAWDWKALEWENEDEYFSWIDRVGIAAIGYFLIGISWIMGAANLDSSLWVVWTIYLAGIAIQGFRDETETPWRRGFGSFGSLISLFMLSLSIDTELFRYVIWMLVGIVAFGFGILYMNRMGESSTLFEGEAVIAQPAVQVAEAVIEQPSDEPQPQVEDEEFEDELEQAFEEIESEEAEQVEEEITEPKETTIPEPVKQIPKATQVPTKEIFDGSNPYDIRLDPSVIATIHQKIASTPHLGFRPVVNVMKNGNISLDFEKI